jgi:hypothetical protein
MEELQDILWSRKLRRIECWREEVWNDNAVNCITWRNGEMGDKVIQKRVERRRGGVRVSKFEIWLAC